MRVIHGEEVHGAVIDGQARCAHYNSQLDIIAIKLKCCNRWFPCLECHAEIEDHKAEKWRRSQFSTRAVLCGACGNQSSIYDYLTGDNECLSCGGKFNPACAKHYHLYFDIGDLA